MPSFTTGISFFYANKGYHFKMHLQVENNVQTAEANSFVTDSRVVYNNLRKAIEDMQHRYQLSANKRRTPASKIKMGNHVFILAKFIKSTWPIRGHLVLLR